MYKSYVLCLCYHPVPDYAHLYRSIYYRGYTPRWTVNHILSTPRYQNSRARELDGTALQVLGIVDEFYLQFNHFLRKKITIILLDVLNPSLDHGVGVVVTRFGTIGHGAEP
jgi:hypothetical protein